MNLYIFNSHGTLLHYLDDKPTFFLPEAIPELCREKEAQFYSMFSQKEAKEFESFCAGKCSASFKKKSHLQLCPHRSDHPMAIYAERHTAQSLRRGKNPSTILTEMMGHGSLTLLREAFPHRHLILVFLCTKAEELFCSTAPLISELPHMVQKLIAEGKTTHSLLPFSLSETPGTSASPLMSVPTADMYPILENFLTSLCGNILFDHAYLLLKEAEKCASAPDVFLFPFPFEVFIQILILTTYTAVSLASEEQETPITLQLQYGENDLHILWEIPTDMLPLHFGHAEEMLSLAKTHPALRSILILLQYLLCQHEIPVSLDVSPQLRHPFLQIDLRLGVRSGYTEPVLEFKHDIYAALAQKSISETLEILSVLLESVHSQKKPQQQNNIPGITAVRKKQ